MKLFNKHIKLLGLVSFISVSSATLAISPIPEKTGVSGFINLGVMGLSVETNMLAESTFSDLGKKRIDSLDKGPDSESSVSPVINFELSYTWAESQTQIFIGSQLADFLRYDLLTGAGVRQGAGQAGIFSLEAISSLDTEVWQDPYVINVDRQDTTRTADGFRVSWGKVLGSEFVIRYSSREVEIDNELSGSGLALTPAQRASLNREGDINRVDVAYAFKLNKQSQIIPRFSIIDHDRDGQAIAHEFSQVDVSFMMSAERYRYVTNLIVGKADYDRVNPVFSRPDDANRLGLTFTMFWPNVFGLKAWTGNAGIILMEDDHAIDFYDNKISGVSFGILHRF